ncbi:MAG TPA: HAD family phosphatase [Hyphomicrobiaceae bacterium]|nr:HAD family phosphatase [Hyphomicrobiaceae bacterium]
MTNPFDCVVFDVGNVLIRWAPQNLYRKLGYSDEATASVLAETKLLEVNHRELDAGAPFGPTLERLARRFPQHAAFISAFDRRWMDMLGGAITPNVAILAALRRAGIPVHAITNFSREKFDETRRVFAFLDTFDECVVSGDLGLVKPEPEIFEHLVLKRGLAPARAVFIDDSAANIATAVGLGFKAVHYAEATVDLAHELQHLGMPSSTLGRA